MTTAQQFERRDGSRWRCSRWRSSSSCSMPRSSTSPCRRSASRSPSRPTTSRVGTRTCSRSEGSLLGGRLADLLGRRRRVFAGGLVLFALASLAGGFAESDGVLIAARAVQGLGAALLSPAALSIVTTTFRDGAERNKALGVWGAVAGAGGAAGVLLGGVLTEYLGWEWVLWVNVPIGIAAAALAPSLIAESRSDSETRAFDFAGAVSVTAGSRCSSTGSSRRPMPAGARDRRSACWPARWRCSASSSRSSSAPPRRWCRSGSSVCAPSRARTWSASSPAPRCSRCSSSSRSTCRTCSATARSRRAVLSAARGDDHHRGRGRINARHQDRLRRSSWPEWA